MIRIPEDPEDCDLAPCASAGSCRGCVFRGSPCPGVRAPHDNTKTFACHPENRPDKADIIYVKRRLYGNEED